MRKTATRKHYVPDGIWDDNRLEMQPLGDVVDTCQRRSELQSHQSCRVGTEEAARRQGVGLPESSNGHGDLVAGVAPGTVHAVFLYFVG